MFSSGVQIGTISSSLSSKKDVDSLKGTLKRMENLVQDLQDELDMKEGLTVKELPNEMSGEQDGKSTTVKTKKHLLHTHNKSVCSFFPLLIIDDIIKAHTADSEPMSKIEAELEAELVRLEFNITSNHLEEQPFDLSEVTISYQHLMCDILIRLQPGSSLNRIPHF
jgi:hypothetical protein